VTPDADQAPQGIAADGSVCVAALQMALESLPEDLRFGTPLQLRHPAKLRVLRRREVDLVPD
jgi:hypothetical protein